MNKENNFRQFCEANNNVVGLDFKRSYNKLLELYQAIDLSVLTDEEKIDRKNDAYNDAKWVVFNEAN